VSAVLKAGNSESQFVIWAADGQSTALPTDITDIAAILPFTASVTSEGDDGAPLHSADFTAPAATDGTKLGILALDKTDIFNILCIPPDTRSAADLISWEDTPTDVFVAALAYCVKRR